MIVLPHKRVKKIQLELSRDKFDFEKEKASDDRMKDSVSMLNYLKMESLKSMIEVDDEYARVVLKEDLM